MPIRSHHPDIEGVVYKVDGKVLAAGSVVNVGDEDVTVTVTAEPADGYRFPDGVTSPVTYELTFTKKGGEKPPTEVNKDKLHATITKLRRSTVPPIRTSRSRCLMTSSPQRSRSMTMTR